ncbi:hypothetical protein DXG03_002360 [Asterophora parasitica]|uniref:Retrotransposon gag domain-containing protein n=1 Tax=Asterophora parasitica TaxID=117018 RepID=A0A9P7FXG6_9AGAR|nr:hypothetical protein DXG03_002360 [Asterophora parasitica]
MSDPKFPIMPLPLLLLEEQLALLESSMLTLLSTGQTTAAALMHVLALVDLTLLMALISVTPAIVQATTITIPIPTDLANLPAFLEAYLYPFLPTIYDGACSMGHDFINACDLYVGLCPKQFSDDHITISWALTCMQQGRVAKFVACGFQFSSIKKLFQDWDQFISTFVDEFYDPNKVVNNSLVLESSAYYQNGHSINAYIDSFKMLWNRSQYLDGHHLIMKFQQGIDSCLN